MSKWIQAITEEGAQTILGNLVRWLVSKRLFFKVEVYCGGDRAFGHYKIKIPLIRKVWVNHETRDGELLEAIKHVQVDRQVQVDFLGYAPSDLCSSLSVFKNELVFTVDWSIRNLGLDYLNLIENQVQSQGKVN